MPKNSKGNPLGVFNIHSVAKHQKTEGEKFFIFGKKYHNAKKTERGTLWDFSTSILSQNSKKLKEDPLRKKNFPKISLAVLKKLKGCLARYGMLRGKTEKPFWFSSLGQMVQFGAIIFCRTFRNYFG